MAAQNQCDQPHVPSDNWRNGPATASTSCSKYTPSTTSSDMDISSPHCISEPEAFALKSSLMSSRPSSSSSPQSTDATQEMSNLEGIEMPSNTLSFGASSNGLPDLLHTQVVTYEDIAHIISLERQVCQNYNCCGIPLADFHALMNHFDRNHVSVIAPGGKRILPPVRPAGPTSSINQPSPPSPSSSSTSSPPSSSSRSPSIESSPLPATPVTSECLSVDALSIHIPDFPVHFNSYPGLALSFGSTESSPNHPCPDSYDILSAFGVEYDFTKDYACYERAYSEQLKLKRLDEQREREEKQQIADRSEREAHGPTQIPSATSVNADQGDDAARSSLSPPPSSSTGAADSHSDSLPGGSPTGPTPPKKLKSREDGSFTNNGGKVPKRRGKSADGGGSSSPVSLMGRKRGKNFKCPRQGCLKSYLNPNGLKYHLEKGTCKFDGPESNTSGSPNSNSSSTSPIEWQPSPVASGTDSAASISLLASATPRDLSGSPLPPLQCTIKPSAFYSPFPPAMSPQEVYQTIMQAALSPMPDSTAQSQAKEQGLPQSQSTPAVVAIITPERVQSASAPVSDQVQPGIAVDASSVTPVPALRNSATTCGRLGQGQAAFIGAASSSL